MVAVSREILQSIDFFDFFGRAVGARRDVFVDRRSHSEEVIPRNAEEEALVLDEETRRSEHNVAAMAAPEWVCVVN